MIEALERGVDLREPRPEILEEVWPRCPAVRERHARQPGEQAHHVGHAVGHDLADRMAVDGGHDR